VEIVPLLVVRSHFFRRQLTAVNREAVYLSQPDWMTASAPTPE